MDRFDVVRRAMALAAHSNDNTPALSGDHAFGQGRDEDRVRGGDGDGVLRVRGEKLRPSGSWEWGLFCYPFSCNLSQRVIMKLVPTFDMDSILQISYNLNLICIVLLYYFALFEQRLLGFSFGSMKLHGRESLNPIHRAGKCSYTERKRQEEIRQKRTIIRDCRKEMI